MIPNRSVLLIDDQKEVLEVTRIFLERRGEMGVATAHSATDALDLLGKQPFDAIIADYDMPEIDGIEFLKILRGRGDTTPVILFTGVGKEHAAIEALNNGADFFIQKGDDPQTQFRTLIDMINRAVDRRSAGRSIGSSQKVLEDAINFFSEPAYAVDHEGKIVAWNSAIAEFTGTDPAAAKGRRSQDVSANFFGGRALLLTDLVLEKDEILTRNRYRNIKRNNGTILATIRTWPDGAKGRNLQMKACPLRDAKGSFIGAIGSVREIPDDTDEAGSLVGDKKGLLDAIGRPLAGAGSMAGLVARLRSPAKADYREGVRLYYRLGNYRDAVPCFDRVIASDPLFAAAWFDQGICYRELGEDTNALRCFLRAVELEPTDEEFLFGLGTILSRVALSGDRKDYLEAAVQVFSKVVEINPNQAEAWNNLGICMKELGKGELSHQYFERAKEILLWNKATRKTRNLESFV
jgi:CheY-like chemotaxis protein/lipoprotein NlpI